MDHNNLFEMVDKTKNASAIDISFLPYIFLAGTLIFFIVILIQNIKIHHRIFAVCRLSNDLQFKNILLGCKQEMGISKDVPLYISTRISTPFLYGVIKPCIVLPDIQFTTQELQHVFQYELTHCKRHDIWLKCMMLLIKGLQRQRKEMPSVEELIKEQVKLSQQVMERMETMDEETRILLQKYYEIINEVDGFQFQYIYLNGARDCVRILKELGVL